MATHPIRCCAVLSATLAVGLVATSACSSDDGISGGGGSAGSSSASTSGGGSAGTGGDAGAGGGTGGGEPTGSEGCGLPPLHPAGGLDVTIDAGVAGDGDRTFFLSLPGTYDPSTPHRLIVGYPGTDWTGSQIQPYLQLEGDAQPDEIFVYLDPLWRDFEGWGNYGGWVLGPHGYPAQGDQDLVFTEAVLDYVAAHYCIDTDRVFATGHSWGGDMAQVVSCFLGDRFRASVPVAANRPYWFETSPGTFIDSCAGSTEVWTMFGSADDHFTWQDYPGQFGDECRDFWLTLRQCSGAGSFADLQLGAADECVAYDGCGAAVRYCLYGAATGHQIPAYYSAATMAFFRSF
ncbi:MAG: prolyl oligopeptidase family serine peptidase [Deltaproteobacteria bacterium]|nr:prolyl oligopeptidase family serine peptidase [Deltaproteobacteria bacterium]